MRELNPDGRRIPLASAVCKGPMFARFDLRLVGGDVRVDLGAEEPLPPHAPKIELTIRHWLDL